MDFFAYYKFDRIELLSYIYMCYIVNSIIMWYTPLPLVIETYCLFSFSHPFALPISFSLHSFFTNPPPHFSTVHYSLMKDEMMRLRAAIEGKRSYDMPERHDPLYLMFDDDFHLGGLIHRVNFDDFCLAKTE